MLKVRSGDLDKMGLLFQRYHRQLFGFLFHMTQEREASEDMMQNVFYRMLRSRHTFTGDGEFRTWMYHLARNVMKDHLKQTRRRGHVAAIADYVANTVNGNVVVTFRSVDPQAPMAFSTLNGRIDVT